MDRYKYGRFLLPTKMYFYGTNDFIKSLLQRVVNRSLLSDFLLFIALSCILDSALLNVVLQFQ